jgi:hypothetical protein
LARNKTLGSSLSFKGLKSMKDKLIEIWLWAVAIAFTVAAICTFAAWVVGLAICVMRWLNG